MERRNTFSQTFYCRESKKNKQGLSPIEMTIVCNGQRVIVNLPMKVSPTDFNRKRKPKEIQEYLDAQRSIVNTILTEMATNGIPLTAEALRSYYRNGGYKPYSIKDLFDEYLAILRLRVGSTLTKSVYRKYEIIRDLFYGTIDSGSEVTAITKGAVLRFFALLDEKYQNSTVVGMKTKFKSVVTFAIDNGRLKINPFQGIKITRERKEIDYLTDDEIGKIVSTPLHNESLERVRDAFIVQLSTGLSYSDLLSLKSEDIQTDENGNLYIVKDRIKTGVTYTTVVLPLWGAPDILKRGLRIISNQKYNAMLKAIQTICGIKTPLHTHLARHSFAQKLLSSSVHLETVSAALGHSNTRVTQQFYCRKRTDDIIREVASAVR